MTDSEPLTENVALFTRSRQTYTDESQDTGDGAQPPGSLDEGDLLS